MSTATIVIITLVFIGIGYFFESAQKESRREDLERDLKRFGVELIDAKIWTTGGKNNKHYCFELTARIPGDATLYEASGLFERNSTDPIIRWVGEDPRRIHARGLP